MKRRLLHMLAAAAVILSLNSCFTSMLIADGVRNGDSGVNQMDNYEIIDGRLLWYNTYEGIGGDAVRKFIYANFNVLDDDGETLTCISDLRPIPQNGSDNLAFPLNGPCEIRFKCRVKEQRYRIVASDIVWHYYDSDDMYRTKTMDDVAICKSGNYRRYFLSKLGGRLDNMLTGYFRYRVSMREIEQF